MGQSESLAIEKRESASTKKMILDQRLWPYSLIRPFSPCYIHGEPGWQSLSNQKGQNSVLLDSCTLVTKHANLWVYGDRSRSNCHIHTCWGGSRFSLLHVLCSELMSMMTKPCPEGTVFALSFLSLWLLQSYSPSLATLDVLLGTNTP